MTHFRKLFFVVEVTLKHLTFPKQKWMGGLTEKCQNDLLHGSVNMDYLNWAISKKKAGLSTYFFEKKPLEFLGLLLYLGNSGQIKASSLEMLQNCVTHPGDFETKNQDHFKFFAIFP